MIDTPGILDHPTEERNSIEMQAVAALVHIRACVLYVMDPSEQCGQSLESQVNYINQNSVKSKALPLPSPSPFASNDENPV